MSERRIDEAARLMAAFAARTGIDGGAPSRRYLWTDAFAVCNLGALHRATGDARHDELAQRLVAAVHAELGRRSPDEARSGWISGLSDDEARHHPTAGGLRIGKPLPERKEGEPFDPELEWDRDGQYFHYLAKWMHALDVRARATSDATMHVWARELAAVAHRAFAFGPPGRRRMRWKMSVDLSRALVPSMGQHDPLDGFVTCRQLRATGRALGVSDPPLDDAIDDFASMIEPDALETDDPLGLGGLLSDSFRLVQLGASDDALVVSLLEAAERGLDAWSVSGELERPAEHRLAFRELGLAIGLAAVPRTAKTASPDVRRRAERIARFEPVGDAIVAFWREPSHRRSHTWLAHEDIDEVMLATALVPEGFLVLPKMGASSGALGSLAVQSAERSLRCRAVTTTEPAATRDRPLLGVPRGVVVLGIVSFLTDVSSEAIFAVLPQFLVGVMGASTVTLGAMEGLADFAASSLDLASGYLSDRIGKRKGLAVVGYGLSSAAKAVLVFVASTAQVFAFRVVERLGKSIRGAPRDALLAGVAPEATRGASFGVHKAFDKAGAILGPLLAFALLERLGSSLASFRKLFLVAVVPAVLSVLVLAFFVPEKKGASEKRVPIRDAIRTLGPGYHRYLVAAAVFSGAYFSYAFLLLAAHRAGFANEHVALLYALFNVSFTVLSVPIGRLGDRIGRRAIIASSYALYAIMSVGFAFATSKAAVIVLFLVYGTFYAIDEGQTKAYIADLVPDEARATAIGAYGFVTALVYLPASLLAGWLWQAFGPEAAFGVAAAIASVAFFVFLAIAPRPERTAA